MLLGITGIIGVVSQSVENRMVAFWALTGSVLIALTGLLLCIAALMMHVVNSHPTLRRLTIDDND
jgi:hypothetical protein